MQKRSARRLRDDWMKVKVTDLKSIVRDLLVGGPYKRQESRSVGHPMSREFAIEGLYFMLWYPDQENQSHQSGLFLVPDSVVFVGRNVDGEEERDTWYFQDTRSFCAYGAYPNNEREGLGPDDYYGRLYALHEEDLFQIVDCKGLIEAASECMARWAKKGKPA
jgi:hypothetical protein